tara:strand:- start:694 stop:1668 length:975 start_codon:yes stop_codon:yes gene_type:complete
MGIFQRLKGISDVFEYTFNNDIQDGLIEYFDWALLDIGNYFNSTLGESAPNGQDYSKLRLSSNDQYTTGQVWEGFRKNWVWQSGINYSPAPLVGTNNLKPGVSGVYVDDNFYPNTTTGTYAHTIDHFNGRVIFDTAIPTTSKVQAEHSYKWINVVYANSVPWLREIQTNTTEPTSSFFDKDKGSWDIPTESRLQLPAIAVEVVATRRFKPYGLGGGQWVYTDVLFHCLAEDEITRNKLVDIISMQSDKNIPLFNSNKINASGDYPLDYRGVPVSGALTYPDLVEKHPEGRIRLINAIVQDMVSVDSDIFGSVVRFTTEGIKNNI